MMPVSFKIFSAVLIVVLLSESTLAFIGARASWSANVQDSATSLSASRREAFSQVIAFLSVPAVVAGAALPAFADVSDGNALPEGAAQFGRVIRAKSDMLGVAKRVSESAADMDKTEWNNVGQFLRKVYSLSDDMKAISAGFYEPDKKKKAVELITDLKKYSKAADAPTGTQNGPEFLQYAQKIITILDDFLELLQDIPDEI